MNNSYRYINGKVAVVDDKQNINVYEYQDCIDELLKQENVVEEMETTIESLKKRKNYLEETKFSLSDKIFIINEDSSIYALALLSCFIVATVISSFFLDASSLINLFKIAAISFGTTLLPASIFKVKRFNKANKIRIANLEEQIDEFEEILDFENAKLDLLKDDKMNLKKNIDESTVIIDNDKIDSLSRLRKRIELYNYYRMKCIDIKKLLQSGKLNDILPKSDIEELNKISQYTDNMLTKKA